MAGLFDDFDKPAPSSDGGGDLFGDFAPVVPDQPSTARSYLGAGLRSGGQGLVAVGAGLAAGGLETNPGVAAGSPATMARQAIQTATGGPDLEGIAQSKRALLEQFKNDPKGFDAVWKSPLYAAHRTAEEFANRAAATMGNLTEAGKAVASQSYDPWSGKPTAGLERLAGDIAQSAPSVIGTGASVALATRNPVAGAAVGGVVEGTLDATGQRQDVRRTLEAAPPEKWAAVPEYQKLVADGWHPDQARRYLIENASLRSSIETGVASGLIAALGGHVLGRVVHGTNAGPLGRGVSGFVTEAPVEGLQGVAQQVSSNLAERRTIDPNQDPLEGTREQLFQGFFVGGAMGGATSAALGRRQRAMDHNNVVAVTGLNPDTAPSQPGATTANNPGNIISGKNADGTLSFRTYNTPEDGVAALIRNVRSYPGAFNGGEAMPLWNPAINADVAKVASLKRIRGVPRSADEQVELDKLDRTIAGRWAPYDGGITDPQVWARAVSSIGNLSLATPLDFSNPATAIQFAQGVHGIEKGPRAAFAPDVYARGFELANSGAPITPGEAPGRGMPDLSPFRSPQMSDIDPNIASSLLEDEKLPPVPKEDLDKAALAAEAPKSGDSIETLNAIREPITAAAEPVVEQTWRLPPELKPNGLRWNQFDLKFSDDLAQSLYIASSKAGGPAAQAHLAWLTNEVGMQKEEIDRLGKLVRERVTEAGRVAQKVGQTGSIEIAPVAEMNTPADRGDTAISEDARATRQGTPNPNNVGAREDLPVVFGPGPGDGNGAPIRQHSLKPGQVVTAAYPNAHASRDYMSNVHNTVQKLISRFAPSARVVIIHNTRGDATASYNKIGDGFYLINPRNMTRFSEQGTGKYNLTTRLTAGFSLLHEVGHVIVDHSFMRGLSESQRAAINTLPAEGYFQEDFLRTLPADQARILREYNAKKQAILENPKATGADFVKQWLSPWKIAHGLGQGPVQEGARRWLKRDFGEAAYRRPAREIALEMHRRWNTLSVHEYLAEQFSRYGYKKSLLDGTELGQTSWFKQTMEWLKTAFKAAKMDKVLGPLTNFDKWLAQLSDTAKPTRGAAKPIPKMTLAGARFDGPIDIATRDQVMFDKALPDAVREHAVELVQHGQPETAREVVESHKGGMEITRWDGSLPMFDNIDEASRNLAKIPGVRKSVQRWWATGARMYAQVQNAWLDVRQKAAVNLDVPGLIYIDNMLSSMKAYHNTLMSTATDIGRRWALSSKTQDGRMQELMRLEQQSGRHLARLGMVNERMEFVETPEFIEAAAKAGLDDRQAKLMLDIKSEYVRRMNTLQAALRRQLMERMADATPERRPYYSEQIRRLAEAFARIRNTPFMPQTRFGNHFLEVKQGDQVVHVESFESPTARDEAMMKLKAATKGYTINPFDVDSRVAVLRVLPLEVLDDVGFEGILTPRQRAALVRTLDPATANPKARKYSPELARITGASRDGLRMFADFMHNDALLLSKMAFRSEFQTGLEMIEGDLRGARQAGDIANSDRLQAIYNGAKADVSQILNPAAEWHALRSAVVMHDLWFSIKSAVANVTDVIKSWASISKQLGDIAGGKVFAKTAFDSAADMMAKGMEQVAGGPPRAWKGLNFEERAAMDRAQTEGHIDETFAASLSGMGSGGVLQRMGMNTVSRHLDTVMRAGMKPMQIMEMFTRRVAFLSSFRGFRLQGLPTEQAYNLAVQNLHIQGGDNSIQNRSALMRGKKGLALIYYNYMRSTLWAMNGGMAEVRQQREAHGLVPPSKGFGNETARMWAAYILLGGLMGLPGAEDADRLIEVAGRQLFGQRFSLREAAFELASVIADNAKAIGIDISPRSIVHGAGTDLLGFDLSGSLSLGNAAPGLGGIDNLGERDSFKALLGMIGPAGRRVQEGLDLFSDSLPWEKKYALFLPVAAQNVNRAIDDEPRFFSGARVLADPRTGEIKRLDTGDRLGMAMGFNPADIAARKELAFVQREFTEYWSARRNTVLAQYWEAKLQRNQDAIHDAMREISHFNQIVPNREMALTADSIERSMSARARNMQREERAQALSRAHQPRYSELTRLVLGEGTR